jgi:phospholipid/cholesterol/gamma-HCH transport system ATP-binding protein
MSEPSIVLENVSKSFDGRIVIDSISSIFTKNEVHVILGKSGTGKSVLLKMLIGLIEPDSGSIKINGQDLDPDKTAKDYKMSYVFQGGALLNSFSVLENVTIYLDEHNIYDKETRISKALKILTELGIEEAANKMISELSGGMQQRVAIARSLIVEPDILLYDEPTSALDPINTKTVSQIINKLKTQRNITQIVVTHDIAFSYSIADRISILDQGKVSITGDIDAIKSSNDPILVSI